MDMPSHILPRNHSLKEDIRAYWSERAKTFDRDIGHRISDRFEAPAWQALIRAGLGDLAGRNVLDLACGTGEVSRMLLALGARVTGIDFAEPMLECARAKLADQAFSGQLCDAENLLFAADAQYDAIIARHLVWTLTDPDAAFSEWFRVLSPGGRILLIDGDWVNQTWLHRAMKTLAGFLGGNGANRHGHARMEEHERILAALPYRDGLTFKRLSRSLGERGFVGVRALPLRKVYLLGMRHAPLGEVLRINAANRFALVAAKPIP